MHSNNILRSTNLFFNAEKQLKQNVKICYPWDKSDSCPRFTGIPPHVVLLAEMAKVVSGQEKLPAAIKDLMVQELDEREMQPGANVERILKLFQESHSRLEAKMASIARRGESDIEDREVHSSAQTGTTFYCYDGRLSLFPSTFAFPKMTFKSLINRWLIPDLDNNIPAFRHLSAKDVMHMKNGRYKLNKMVTLMGHVEKCGHVKNLWKTSGWDIESVDALYDGIKESFNFQNPGKVRRICQIAWRSMYNFILLNKNVLVGET